ncbi:MAG: glucosylceramidase [Bacteroidales bacterium]|jgi:glucosylceramidase|nr:glucosylceramidase [Bacteroidales bacterium]
MKDIITSRLRFSATLIVLALFLAGFIQACSSQKKDLPPDDINTDTIPVKYVDTDVMFWLTKADSTVRFRRQNVALNFSEVPPSGNTITVDPGTTFQTIDGFGFALTGGSAYLINRLPAAEKNSLLQELFSADSTFIGTSYLRISIGSSDLDAYVFSYSNIDPNSSDPELSSFDITPDTYNLIPVLKAILAINPEIKIMGSPWSAPVWMKTNKNSVGGSLKPEYYGVYAKYFVKYLQAMKSYGITLDAITVQNEPEYGGNNPSMLMTAVEQADFIKNHLGPAFQEAGLTTKIVIFDHNCDHPGYPITVLNDPDARKYIDGSAFHLYAGDISALSQVHNAYPDKNLYFTEQWVGGSPTIQFGSNLKWHVKNLIIGAPQNWSRVVLEWNLASDPSYKPHTPGGCSKCLGAVTIGSSVSRNVAYYIIAHASKFVRPGSVRIGSTVVAGLPNVAYKAPDGRKILIVLNEGVTSQTFNIRFGERHVKTSLEAGSVATYVW